jgi:hypothetical protein
MHVPAASSWLHDGELWGQLTPDSRRALTTAAGLQAALKEIPGADWSPVVTLAFKAFEIEVLVRVLRPFRSFLRVTLLDAELEQARHSLDRDEWSRPFGRFLAGGRPPPLADAMLILGSLRTVPADTPGNVLALLKRWLRGRLPRAHRFWGPRRLADKVGGATVALRNRYVHDRVAGGSEARSALQLLWGGPFRQGPLNQGLGALTSGLPGPTPAPEPCPTCGAARWHYPRRDPDRYCPRCPALLEPLPRET